MGEAANRIVMQQADGDRSELLLTKVADNARLTETIGLLIEEAEGR